MDYVVETITSLTVLVGAVVALILSILKGQKSIEENLPVRLKESSDINAKITIELEKLKELVNADRVQVYDFHNGGHYANGRSALKISCTFEVARMGVRPKQMQLQNIPISCISRFTSHLLDKNYLEVTRLEDIHKTMPATYQLKSDMQLTSFYDVILNNEYNEPVGFLAVQYTKNPYGVVSERDKEHVCRTKFYVEKHLDLLRKNK